MGSGDSNGLLALRITSNVSSAFSERRFPGNLLVGELKGKLELLTGANAKTMKLSLLDDTGAFVAKLEDDEASLASCGVVSGMKIHVVDESQPGGAYDGEVPEETIFKLSSQEYKEMEGTVHDFLRKNRLGKYSEEYRRKLEETRKRAEHKAASMKVGDRCQVTAAKCPVRRGQIMFIGEVEFQAGVWIGVKYDEPLGKNDGSVKGKRYFECPANYGGFVSPLDVEVGDFPEELDQELAQLSEDLEEL